MREQAQGAALALVFDGGTEVRLFPPRRDSAGNILTPVQPDTANPIIVQVNYSAGTPYAHPERRYDHAPHRGTLHTPAGREFYVPFSVQQYAPGFRR